MVDLIVIPARLQSSRFPSKLLYELGDLPVLQHTWNNAINTGVRTVIATDSKEIYELANTKWCAEVYFDDDPRFISGSARVQGLLNIFPDVKNIVNLQADEPELTTDLLAEFFCYLDSIDLWDNDSVGTMAVEFDDLDDYVDKNSVKVVLSESDRALYFSRSPIPTPYWNGVDQREFLLNRMSSDQIANLLKISFRHIGIYAYSVTALSKFVVSGSNVLSQFESLEQLGYLYQGGVINCWKIPSKFRGGRPRWPLSINTKTDIVFYGKNRVCG